MEGRLTRMPHVNELHEQHDQILVVSFAAAISLLTTATAPSPSPSSIPAPSARDSTMTSSRSPARPRALPPAVRTRDFQISPEQAAKLQPGGWRRFVAAFAAPGSIFSKQLGVGMATLGIVGLLIGAAPSIQLGGLGGSAASAPAASMPAAAAGNQPGAVELRGPEASPAASAAAAGGRRKPGSGRRVARSRPVPERAATTRWLPSRPGTSPTSPARRRRPRPRRGTSRSPTRAARTAATDRSSSRLRHRHRSPAKATAHRGLVIASSILLAAGLLVLLLRSIGRRAAAG